MQRECPEPPSPLPGRMGAGEDFPFLGKYCWKLGFRVGGGWCKRDGGLLGFGKVGCIYVYQCVGGGRTRTARGAPLHNLGRHEILSGFLRDKNLRRGLLEFLPFQIGAAESRFAKPLTKISKAGGYLSMDGCLVNLNFLTEAIFALGTASSKHIGGRSVGRITKVVQPILIPVYPHLP